jgi:hypothetical protein
MRNSTLHFFRNFCKFFAAGHLDVFQIYGGKNNFHENLNFPPKKLHFSDDLRKIVGA